MTATITGWRVAVVSTMTSLAGLTTGTKRPCVAAVAT
jgi:hypothetical protein